MWSHGWLTEDVMRSRWREARVIIVAAAPLLLAACGAPDGPCDEEDCQSIASGLVDPCESFGCGGNAAIGDTVFHELRVGLPNEDGDLIVGFKSGAGAAHRLPIGTPMALDVQGDTLLGLVDGQPAVQGDELQGATMHIRLGSGTDASVRITSISTTDFWIGAETGRGPVTMYELYYEVGTTPPGSSAAVVGERALCDGSPEDPIPGRDGTIQIDSMPNLAVVFAGDRYDPKDVTVSVPGDPRDPRSPGGPGDLGDPGWFNIACVGTALAKMHFLRHTTAGSGSSGSPSNPQRQAMLKLLSADYCGDGTVYARNGTPLFFRDQEGRFDPTRWYDKDRVGEFEAIWTADGALCLDDPRRWDPTQSSADLRAEIVTACGRSSVQSLRRTIPRCTAEQLASWQSFGPMSRNVGPP
jgi:hypothetical protein